MLIDHLHRHKYSLNYPIQEVKVTVFLYWNRAEKCMSDVTSDRDLVRSQCRMNKVHKNPFLFTQEWTLWSDLATSPPPPSHPPVKKGH